MLGYRRDLTASTLRRADRQSASIGLIIEDVSNPFFSAVHRGVEDVARPHGVLTFVGSSDEQPERERELAETFGARGVDGLVIVPCAPDQSYLMRDHEAGTALVFVDRPPRFMPGHAVVSDNVGGARGAVEHLLAAGHTRIAFLGDRLYVFTAQRAPGRATARRSAAGRAIERTELILQRAGLRGDARAPAGRRPADRALHRPEPDHHRRDPGAALRSACSARSRWSASTTSRSATWSSRASRWSPRTRTRSAATRASCCSPARPSRGTWSSRRD